MQISWVLGQMGTQRERTQAWDPSDCVSALMSFQPLSSLPHQPT